jgi:hypothetical protein
VLSREKGPSDEGLFFARDSGAARPIEASAVKKKVLRRFPWSLFAPFRTLDA